MPRKTKAPPRAPLHQHLADAEATLLREALEAEGWVMLRAAKRLGMQFSSFQRAVGRHPALKKELRSQGRKPGRPPRDE